MKSTVMIAATGSGKGKTTFVSGLLSVLNRHYSGTDKAEKKVHAFKCGPDYIDPMFHRRVLNTPSANLDSFFLDNKSLLSVFRDNSGEVNVIEAAMGLYDGIGTTDRASAYETASILKCPIILLVDARGMGYSIVALIRGFQSMDRDGLIKGVVINRISEKYYSRIAPVIESNTGLKVYGYMPVMRDASLESRHLGLMAPKECDFDRKLEVIAGQLEESVDYAGIIKAGENCSADGKSATYEQEKRFNRKIKIAVAKDDAFSFYYEENIKLLESAGGEVVYFSPVNDASVPEGADVIVLYGGYPENHARELSDNKSMLESIRNASENGTKIIAECGGFMYLLDSMEVKGELYEMAGLIRGTSYRTPSLVRFGYVNVVDREYLMRAHEFHHYDVRGVGYSTDVSVKNEASGDEYLGIIRNDRILAGFPHMYYLSCRDMIIDFING